MTRGTRSGSEDWQTSLGYAVWSDNLARVRELLNAGTNPDATADSKTPLMEAVDEMETFYDADREAVTRLLLDAGASVTAADEDGRTALHYAVGAGARAVDLLLRAGAVVDATARNGQTPLHEAVDRMNLSAVAALRAAGADPTVPDSAGLTPRALATDPLATEPERNAMAALLAAE